MEKRKGQGTLAITLLILILGAIFTATTVYLSQTESRFRVTSEFSNKSFYLADAGVDLAVYKLNLTNGTTFSYTLSNVPLGEGVIDVTISTTSVNDRYKIKSFGYVPSKENPKGKRGIECYVDLGGVIPEVFQYAICSKTDITMQNSATTQSTPTANAGDIRTNGNIVLKNNAVVNGDAIASGSITLMDGAMVTGDIEEGASTIEFPSIDTDGLEDEATLDSYDHTSFWNKTWNGVNKTETSWQILGNCTIKNSTITFTEGLKVGSWFPKTLTIDNSSVTLKATYVKGDIVIKGDSYVNLNGTVYVTDDFTASNNSKIYGNHNTIFTTDLITFQNSSEVHEVLLMSDAWANGIFLKNGSQAQSVVCYAPNGDIQVQNDAVITGSIVGEEVTVKNSAQIRLDQDLSEYNLPGSSHKTYIYSWKEITQ